MKSHKKHTFPIAYLVVGVVIIIVIAVVCYTIGEHYSFDSSQDDTSMQNDTGTPAQPHIKYLPNRKGYLHQ